MLKIMHAVRMTLTFAVAASASQQPAAAFLPFPSMGLPQIVAPNPGQPLDSLRLGYPTSASPRNTLSIETGLRRTIPIEGAVDERFQLAQRMKHYKVPGVSIAVIEGCRILDARGFGRGAVDGDPVTAETLFQAGSISKSVAAIAALRLVEQDKLSLDSDVRMQLKSWRFPDTPSSKAEPITLRRLLGHTAGTNVPGLKGYLPGAPLPDMTQILNGLPPANTPAIKVEGTPGSRWSYSGGGYVVTQALMTESTGETFPELMDELVLRPLGMSSSSYQQPSSRDVAKRTAAGTSSDGSALPGKWRVYPEMAAAGLWATPSDLARFVIGVARSVRGEDNAVLGSDTAEQLMTRGLGNWGLGVDLGPAEGPRQFSHTGKTIGYTSMFVMYPDSCQGAVVMTNGYDGGWLINEIMRSIGDVYRWPARKSEPAQTAVPLTDTMVERFTGVYRLRDFPSERFSISRAHSGVLYWAREGHVGRDLLPQSEERLFSPDSVMTIEAIDPGAARARVLQLSFGGGINLAERVD